MTSNTNEVNKNTNELNLDIINQIGKFNPINENINNKSKSNEKPILFNNKSRSPSPTLYKQNITENHIPISIAAKSIYIIIKLLFKIERMI